MSTIPLDLSRYEGHTPGPWGMGCFGLVPGSLCQCRYIFADGYFGSVASISRHTEPSEQEPCGNDCPPESEALANARLIADAPLLLAEVKRQREEIAAKEQRGKEPET